MKRFVFALMALAMLAVSCGKESGGSKKHNGEVDEPDVFVANALSINGNEPVTYETGELASVLNGKTVTSLVWTDISRMNATDVMALRAVKNSVKAIDMFKLRFIADDTTYEGYSSATESVDPELLPQYLCNSFVELESVVLPKKVLGIGSSAFGGCKKLVSCTLPPKLEYMQRYCFHNCSSLESITLPETFIKFSDSDNFANTGLKSFIFPDSATGVGASTFDNSKSLESIHFGASCNAVNDYFPGACYNLKTITITDKNPNMKVVDGALLTADGSKLLLQPLYSSNDRLLVKAAPTVGMRLVAFPYSTLEFEEGCQVIKTYFVAFSKAGQSIIFPSTVTSIQPGYCTNNPGVTTLVVKSINPPGISDSFLPGFANLTEIRVPLAYVSIYQKAAGWSSYAHLMKAI